MASRQTIIADVKVLLKAGEIPDEFAVAEADYAGLIAQALARYSKDRPEHAFKDSAGDGTAYDFALPSDWDDALSTVLGVEYPQGEREPVFLQQRDWTIYGKGTSAAMFRLLRLTPATGETVRLFYSRSHTATDSATSVPAADQQAVAKLAAAEGCGILSRKYAETAEPIIGADSVNYQSKSGEYARLAKELRRQYLAHLGQKEGDTAPAAGGVVHWDEGLTGNKGRYLTHGGPSQR